tara:strand:+ start:68 stop:256 length:189 start_codon:yes stop_codon:yes gene_type:complete
MKDQEKKYGVAYLNISVYLEMDLTKEKIEDVVNEMNYKITDKLISHTQINGFELNNNYETTL